MPSDLEGVFGELGISQYLDVFVDQGFDTWETILDITESDLDALGVKLGHRRKLQRRIANCRGQVPDISLGSPTQQTSDVPRVEAHRASLAREDSKDVAVITKRKYRRHPKPDDNAPERPPSAYVLFSNKMRDDLKGRNLTFTEIAKLVGENWQSLSPVDKEPFESAALRAKEKYNHDLAEYKKTANYRKYAHYLQDFKQKQASQNQAKDASKRLKLETVARLHHKGSSTSASASGTASGSDSQAGSEPPPPTRKRRVGSTVSNVDSLVSSAAPTVVSHQSPIDEPMNSPPAHFELDPEAPRTLPLAAYTAAGLPHHRNRRPPSWNDGRRAGEVGGQPHLPSLSDMLGDGRMMNGASRSPDRSTFGAFGAPPMLTHEHSSAGSTGSSASYYPPRTPSEPSLPIHALLTNKSSMPSATPYEPLHSPFFNGASGVPVDAKAAAYMRSRGSDVQSPPLGSRFPPARASPGAADSPMGGVAPSSKEQPGFDGMSALLQAGEIVGRRLP